MDFFYDSYERNGVWGLGVGGWGLGGGVGDWVGDGCWGVGE